MRWEGRFKTGFAKLLSILCLVSAVSFTIRGDPAQAGNEMAENGTGVKRLTVEDSLGAMVRHPFLAAFARHMLPRPEDADRDIPLKNISRLMPWHSHIMPEAVLAGVNRIIDDSARGQTVFYPFYAMPPLAEQTGLFFFRGRPDAPFALICPGGGFRYVGSLHEGFPLAMVLTEHEFNAFVLQYRTGGERIACEDMAKALSWIFRHAKELNVDVRGYSVWGGSAGARMAADLGSYGSKALGGDDVPKPACVVMAYTGHDWISRDDPPTFAVVSKDDPIASACTMNERIKALKRHGTDAEIMIFNHAGHGFGTGEGTDAAGWMSEAVKFWERQLKKTGIRPE